MRRLLAALGLIGLISPAFAADYELPALRGSQMFVPAYPTYFSWQGFYAGGQVSFTSASSVLWLASITSTSTRRLVEASGWRRLSDHVGSRSRYGVLRRNSSTIMVIVRDRRTVWRC